MPNAPTFTTARGMRHQRPRQLIHDGLDPYGDAHMGGFGDSCSKELDITREAQDNFAKASYERAQAQQEGWFKSEIVPVEIKARKGTVVVDTDEEPGMFRPDKMVSLRPVFGKEGTVTAATASKIDDGVPLSTRESGRGRETRQTIVVSVSDGTFAQTQHGLTVPWAHESFDKCRFPADAIDCYKLTSVFWLQQRCRRVDHDKVNCYGAVSRHPSVVRRTYFGDPIVVMEKDDLKKGCAHASVVVKVSQ